MCGLKLHPAIMLKEIVAIVASLLDKLFTNSYNIKLYRDKIK